MTAGVVGLVLVSLVARQFAPGGGFPPAATEDAAPPALPAAPLPTTSTSFPSDTELTRIAGESIDAARPQVRRAARSAPDPALRARALRLLADHDPGAPTARICMRALRLDDDALVRRAGAECLGRLGPSVAAPTTPALVAALDDASLDVVVMAGWALAAVGDSSSAEAVVQGTRHPDPRVARLFDAYARRLLGRLGLSRSAPQPRPARDAAGNTLVPPAGALLTTASGLEAVGSVAWLGIYGLSAGWFHGAYQLSAHGGPGGAGSAGLGGLAGGALGAALASTYGLTRATTLHEAQVVVQFGMFGTLAGYGAGVLTGFPPSATVAAANMSLVGTLAGTALGVALVETRPPTAGALGAGLVTGLSGAIAVGALWAGLGLAPRFAQGAALLAGSAVGATSTLATAHLDLGLFPVAGALVGTLGGAGMGAIIFAGPADRLGSEAAGWGVAASTLAGAALGAVAGLAVPAHLDPLNRLHPGALRLGQPMMGMLRDAAGTTTPLLAMAGSF